MATTKTKNKTLKERRQQHESHFFDATLNAPLLANHALPDWRQTLADLSIPQLIVTGERSQSGSMIFVAIVKKLSMKNLRSSPLIRLVTCHR